MKKWLNYDVSTITNEVQKLYDIPLKDFSENENSVTRLQTLEQVLDDMGYEESSESHLDKHCYTPKREILQ